MGKNGCFLLKYEEVLDMFVSTRRNKRFVVEFAVTRHMPTQMPQRTLRPGWVI
jgi:hypothetical protein